MPERLSDSILESIDQNNLPKGIELLMEANAETDFLHEIHLDRIYKGLKPENQEIFRRAVVDALCNYKPDNHKSHTLPSLIYLTGDTEAVQAIPKVVELIDSKKLQQDNENDQDILRASIGTIFWLTEKADDNTRQNNIELFNKWFKDPYYERYNAMLLNGICRFEPDAFPELFTKFIEVAQKTPGFFHLSSCIQESIRFVTPEKMRGLLEKLPKEEKEIVKSVLDEITTEPHDTP